MALVFQYGSNLSSARLNDPTRLNGAAKLVEIASTAEDFDLCFDVPSKSNNCAATNMAKGNRKVWGVVYEVPDDMMSRSTAPAGKKSFDAIEGEGINYERRPIEVIFQNGDGRPQSVLTYCGIERMRDYKIKTSVDYVKHIFKGLEEHPSIPREYVEYVRTRILLNNPELATDLNELA